MCLLYCKASLCRCHIWRTVIWALCLARGKEGYPCEITFANTNVFPTPLCPKVVNNNYSTKPFFFIKHYLNFLKWEWDRLSSLFPAGLKAVQSCKLLLSVLKEPTDPSHSYLRSGKGVKITHPTVRGNSQLLLLKGYKNTALFGMYSRQHTVHAGCWQKRMFFQLFDTINSALISPIRSSDYQCVCMQLISHTF